MLAESPKPILSKGNNLTRDTIICNKNTIFNWLEICLIRNHFLHCCLFHKISGSSVSWVVGTLSLCALSKLSLSLSLLHNVIKMRLLYRSIALDPTSCWEFFFFDQSDKDVCLMSGYRIWLCLVDLGISLIIDCINDQETVSKCWTPLLHIFKTNRTRQNSSATGELDIK